MISENQSVMYSEVYQILNILGKEYIEKIPPKLYNFIKKAKSEGYSTNYNPDKPLKEQNISRQALAFICMLHYNYWCESQEEKDRIDEILNENEKQLYSKNEYNLFQNTNNRNAQRNDKGDVADKNNDSESKSLVKVEKKGIWARIIGFLKKLRRSK